MIKWSTPVNNLRSGGALARQAADRAMHAESPTVLGRVKSKTRVKTRALQDSERVDVVDGVMTVTAGGGIVDYAWYQEDGTYKMTGTHYIRDGLTESAPAVMDAVAREISAEFS